MQPVRRSIRFFAALAITTFGLGCVSTPTSEKSHTNPTAFTIGMRVSPDGALVASLGGPGAPRMIELQGLEQWVQRGAISELCCNIRREGDQLLSAVDEEADAIRFRMDPIREPLNRQYPPLVAFDTGGVIIRPASFIPMDVSGPVELELAIPEDWTLLAVGIPDHAINPTQSRIRLEDPAEFHEAQLMAVDPSLFAGGEHDHLIDPSLPETLRRKLDRDLPIILSQFNHIFDHGIGIPRIAVHWDHRQDDGFGWDGDAYGSHSIRVRLRGADIAAIGDAQYRQLLQLVAHELAHLWNAGVSRPDEHSTLMWMSEGGADFLGRQVLRKAGLLDTEQWLASVNQSMNRCRLAVATAEADDKTSLLNTPNVAYHCGDLFFTLVSASVPTISHGGWPELVASSRQNTNGHYNADDFLHLIQSADAPPDVMDAMRRFPGTDVTELDALIDVLLKDTEWSVNTSQQSLLPYERERSIAVMHVLRQDCTGRIGLWNESDSLTLDAAQCETIPDRFALTELASRPVMETHDILGNLREACQAGAVDLRDASGTTIRVRCEEPPPTIPGKRTLRMMD